MHHTIMIPAETVDRYVRLAYAPCCGDDGADIGPSDIADIGTPICGECGEDLTFTGARVTVTS